MAHMRLDFGYTLLAVVQLWFAALAILSAAVSWYYLSVGCDTCVFVSTGVAGTVMFLALLAVALYSPLYRPLNSWWTIAVIILPAFAMVACWFYTQTNPNSIDYSDCPLSNDLVSALSMILTAGLSALYVQVVALMAVAGCSAPSPRVARERYRAIYNS